MAERTLDSVTTPRGDTSILPLGDERAADPALSGAKAANIVAMDRSGLPTLPGFVITTAVTSLARTPEGHEIFDDEAFTGELHERWRSLSENGRHAVVVRSSSTVEDSRGTSLAGLFDSVLGVRSWGAFTAAIERVLASRSLPRLGDAEVARTSGMGVLVQRQVDVAVGGVAFGADPVVRRTDRVLVAAVRGTPDRLVSGKTSGVQYRLSRRGRILEVDGEKSEAPLSASQRRRLVRLVRDSAALFGGPQDVEWAIDHDGRLWALQSRPITTDVDELVSSGPVLGPGPVSETFPKPLYPLEEDLWIPPLREALFATLSIVGARTERNLQASPGVIAVNGRPAIDLELSGVIAGRRPRLAYVRPIWTARRMAMAWRIGRLRAAVWNLSEDVLRAVDAALADIPPLDECNETELLRILERGHRHLVALHGHEMLAGILSTPEARAPSAPAEALSVLRRSRRLGFDDQRILMTHPVVLSLTAPAIEPNPLPETRATDEGSTGAPADRRPTTRAGRAGRPGERDGDGDGDAEADSCALARESLRMRVRWVQELEALAARALGARMHRAGLLRVPEDVRLVHLDELRGVVVDGAPLPDLDGRGGVGRSAPLPAEFRLTREGIPVPVDTGNGRHAVPAGGGRVTGRVHVGPTRPAEGAVLVVQTLDPDLAAWLPRITALVSETGSPLSHLSILAREHRIPTVVGVADATRRFSDGELVLVDGSTGEVLRVDGVDQAVGDDQQPAPQGGNEGGSS